MRKKNIEPVNFDSSKREYASEEEIVSQREIKKIETKKDLKKKAKEEKKNKKSAGFFSAPVEQDVTTTNNDNFDNNVSEESSGGKRKFFDLPDEQVEVKTKDSKRPAMWNQRQTYTPLPEKDKSSWKYVLYVILLTCVIAGAVYFVITKNETDKDKNVKEEYDSDVIPRFKIINEDSYDTSAKDSYKSYLPYDNSENWDLKVTYKMPEDFGDIGNQYYYSKDGDSTCTISFGKLNKQTILNDSGLEKISASAYAYSYAKGQRALKDFGLTTINNVDWYVITESSGSQKTFTHIGEIDNDFYYIKFVETSNKNNKKACDEGYQYFIKSFIKI